MREQATPPVEPYPAGLDSIELELIDLFEIAIEARDKAQQAINRIQVIRSRITRTRIVELQAKRGDRANDL